MFIEKAVDISCVIYFKTDVISVSLHVGFYDYFYAVLAKGCIFIKTVLEHISSILEKHQIHHIINTNEACSSLKLCNDLTLKLFCISCDLLYLVIRS